MLQYRCKNHINPDTGKEEPLSIHGPVCPYCGNDEDVQVTSQLYWCDTCKIPLYDKECECCGGEGRVFVKDVRVVFPEEKALLELLLQMKAGELDNSSVWNATGNTYYSDGKRLNLRISTLKEYDIDKIRIEYQERIKMGLDETYFDKMIARFVKGNHNRYKDMESEAIQYIQDETADYAISDMFVSFSGGKDSTVVAELVRQAVSEKVLNIFGDTTLEFPMTEQYVADYRRMNKKTPVLSSRNKEKDFDSLCELLGPPSRVMRWCCTIFKTGALSRKTEGLFRKKSKIIAFQGIRHSESTSRSKYKRTSMDSKIAKQLTLCPIIEWQDFDVWLYILSRKILFNPAYRLGYARVGCWCCPNNSNWSEFLSMIHMPEQYEKFHQMLMDFAIKVGMPDPDVYVDDGKWKARQGGNGLEYARTSIVSYEPCVKENNAFNYELTKPVTEELYELFKPFGTINYDLGNKRLGEVYVLDKNNVPVLSIQGRAGQNKIKIVIFSIQAFRASEIGRVRELINCQITKYQMCMGCKACESVCRFDALSVKANSDGTTAYKIDADKCRHCMECVGHFSVGCYMRKVLTIKR